jgi:hypothetical protein
MITTEAVQANPDVCNAHQAEQVVREARKVFAILVLIGRDDAIGDLLAEELIDEYLPLVRREIGDDQIIGSRQVAAKVFMTLQDWEPRQVDDFLAKQWLFQAPVFNAPGYHYDIFPECALPIQSQEEIIGSTSSSIVHACTVRPSHFQQEFHVSIALA